MQNFFYAVYYIELTSKEIEKVENEDFIDDDEKFENFCFQSKGKRLVALFADKVEAELFSESITNNSGIAKVSDPVCVIKKLKLKFMSEKN